MASSDIPMRNFSKPPVPAKEPPQKAANGSAAPYSDLEDGTCAPHAFRNQDVHSLAWHNVTMRVTDRVGREKKVILTEATGIAYQGQIMAIMGPSGSGKTTLLNALAQRTTVVEGQVLVNGAEHSIATHRSISSYVEQEDTLIGSLTTQQTLHFAARLALPRSITRKDIQLRVQSLIAAFGLQQQANTLIGTPIQKGLSGGQKRRVSIATQLITAPRVLYLDEPTSGLDSTASFEIMSYIKNIAKQYNLIVIASIHQPSTKTFDLFDQVTLLSQGRTCYVGSVSDFPLFLADRGMPVPPLTNSAEHALDVANVDFSSNGESGLDQRRVDRVVSGWRKSEAFDKINVDIQQSTSHATEALSPDSKRHASSPQQLLTLMHRAWIKSYRDYVTYWIRVVMYLGLAVMMGTVWLRLGTVQRNIQPFINAIFFGSAFMSFMAVAYVPAFLEDRAIFVKERANGLYGPTVFLLANFLIGLPYLFLISIIFSIVAYWLTHFEPTGAAFFTWVLWLFLDLLAAESLVVLVSSLFPNFVLALAIIAFANGLWMSVGGFLVSLPVLNVFWKYVFHYIDYQAYVFQGMMVNEFKDRTYDCEIVQGQCHCMYPSSLENECKIAGSAVLSAYGYATGRGGKWIGIMIGIIVVYRLFGWMVTYIRRT